MKHIARIGKRVGLIIAAALPTILVDPSFRHYIATHPTLAAIFPLVAGVISAGWKASYTDRQAGTVSQP